MNGNYFYRQTKKDIAATCKRIGFDLDENEIILIANARYWEQYSGASATNDMALKTGRRLNNILLDAEIDYDYPELVGF